MPVIGIPLSEAIRSVHEFYVLAGINNTQKASQTHNWEFTNYTRFYIFFSNFRVSNTKCCSKGTLDQFVTTTEEPGIHKPVNGSPSSICRLRFPLF